MKSNSGCSFGHTAYGPCTVVVLSCCSEIHHTAGAECLYDAVSLVRQDCSVRRSFPSLGVMVCRVWQHCGTKGMVVHPNCSSRGHHDSSHLQYPVGNGLIHNACANCGCEQRRAHAWWLFAAIVILLLPPLPLLLPLLPLRPLLQVQGQHCRLQCNDIRPHAPCGGQGGGSAGGGLCAQPAGAVRSSSAGATAGGCTTTTDSI